MRRWISSLLVLAVVLLFTSAAEAVCTVSQSTPYTPSTIPLPTTNCCCCWNNDVVYQVVSGTLTRDFWCCDHWSAFCGTFRETWSSTVRPVSHPDQYNPKDPNTGAPTVCGVVWDYLDLDVCRCSTDGYVAHDCDTNTIGYGNTYLVFCCTECPWPGAPPCP